MIHIRPMITRDTNSVMQIESQSFPMPWTLEEMIRMGRDRKVIRFVAEMHGVVMGYLIYSIEEDYYEILNLAVYEGVRRNKIATKLVTMLLYKLTARRRNRIHLAISEENLTGQKFFKAHAFRAVSIAKNHFVNGDTAYIMQRHLSDPVIPQWKRTEVSNLARAAQFGH